MTNIEKYQQVFCDLFEVSTEELKNLKYQDVNLWDSVGHMSLIASLEEMYDILMDTDDIIDFSSYEKGIEILSKYNVDM
jgi:acyl carrier protein